jgi:hypothetical protein
MAEGTSDQDGAPLHYTLRVPVRTLGQSPILGLESPTVVQIDDLEVTVRAAPPLLVTTVDGFATESAAAEFIPRVVAGLWGLVVRWNIAFRANFVPQPITYASDPVAAGNNLARSFGQDSGTPVDAIVGGEDTVIFPSGKRLRWLTFGEASGIVQTQASRAIPTFTQALSNVHAAALIADEKFKTAIELFNAYFYEASLRARFLTVVMIFEVLAPSTEKHPAVQALINEWKTQLQSKIADTSDKDTRLALEALDRELEFRRETSIRQRVRQLVREEFQHLSRSEREELEKHAVNAYDARGSLIHSGRLPDADLETHHEKATRIVRRILAKRLGIDAADG